MALPDFSMRQLLEAGVHFGHQTHRWNPKMAPFIYGARNDIHIIDLDPDRAAAASGAAGRADTVANGGRVLFVGTKRQAQEAIAEAAQVVARSITSTHRWLGGTLTNWNTISNSIKRLQVTRRDAARRRDARPDQEGAAAAHPRAATSSSGRWAASRTWAAPPDLMFVIDTNKESIAIAEARKLDIPVVAVVDTNCDPDGINYPDPRQ